MMMTEQEAREKVVEAGKKLLEKQLVARTWGNLSARIDENHFVITPSGRPYESLTPEDLVKVCLDDGTYEGGRKPSSEKGIHAAAYALRPEVSFVVHTHQFYASVIAASGQGLPEAPCAGYGLPGTGKLKSKVALVMEQHPETNSFLMEKHGALLLGSDAEQAFCLAERLEEAAKQAFLARVSMSDEEECHTEEAVTADSLTVVKVSDGFTRRYGKTGRALPAYIDDFAQLMGGRIACKANRTVPGDGNGLLWRDGTGLCAAQDPEDARAMAFILRKNCAAALWAGGFSGKEPLGKPLGAGDALLQRTVYRLKYSKLKNKA